MSRGSALRPPAAGHPRPPPRAGGAPGAAPRLRGGLLQAARGGRHRHPRAGAEGEGLRRARGCRGDRGGLRGCPGGERGQLRFGGIPAPLLGLQGHRCGVGVLLRPLPSVPFPSALGEAQPGPCPSLLSFASSDSHFFFCFSLGNADGEVWGQREAHL